MEIIILVGGKGTRLKRVVKDRPKPLADVNGRPFLEYLMDWLINNNANHFILSTGYKSKKIREHFGNAYRSVKISYSDETEPLGTGGAVRKAINFLHNENPFLVVNGDTFFNINIQNLINSFNKSNADLSIALFKANEGERYGLVELDDQNHMKNQKFSKADIGQLASGGVFLMSNKILDYFSYDGLNFSMEHVFIPTIMNNGGVVTGVCFNDIIFDIGTPSDYKRFCNEVLQN
jgi:D-glycero-alpha-D-manno-heptose 1-phosphate guanylyltransferase